MKKFRLFAALAAALICLTFVSGCKKEVKKKIEEETPVYNASLILGTTSLSLLVGESYELKFVLRNSNATVTFSSTDPEAVSVSEAGLITARSIGNAVITVSAGGVSAMCTVFVSAAPSLLISAEKSVLMVVGGEYPLSVKLLKGREAVSGEITYESDDTSVVSVKTDGVLSAVSKGKAEITVSASAEGKTVYGKIAVTVNENVWIDSPLSIGLTLADGASELEYTVKDNAGNPVSGAVAVVKIDNEALASVSGNVITPKKCGLTYAEINYGGIISEVALEISLGTGEDEYNLFLDTPALENVRSGRNGIGLNGWVSTANQPKSVVLTDRILGGKTGNKLCVTSEVSSGTSAKYVGLACPSRLSKAEIAALKSAGYGSLSVEVFVESYAGKKIWMTIAETGGKYIFNNDNPKNYLGKWQFFTVSIDTILENYDDLASGALPLLRFYSDDNDNDTPYTVYVAGLKFTR